MHAQDSSEERVMAVSSDTVSVCEVNEIGQLKVLISRKNGRPLVQGRNE